MARVRVPASTSNLGAGFDAIGLALELFLDVEMSFSDTLQIDCSGQDGGEIAVDERNLVYTSALNVFRLAGAHIHPLRIVIENQVPLSRGLGSSGAATVAGMLCANELVGAGLSKNEILSMAVQKEGHPENVSASLLGGMTLSCFGDQGLVTKKVPVADEHLKAVVVIPQVAVPTQGARKVLPAMVSHKDAVFNLQRSALLSYAFLTGDYDVLRDAMQDRLHQPYRKHLLPGYDEFVRIAYESGGLGVSISGSGSTIICFARDAAEQVCAAWQLRAEQLAIEAEAKVLSTCNSGAQVL